MKEVLMAIVACLCSGLAACHAAPAPRSAASQRIEVPAPPPARTFEGELRLQTDDTTQEGRDLLLLDTTVRLQWAAGPNATPQAATVAQALAAMPHTVPRSPEEADAAWIQHALREGARRLSELIATRHWPVSSWTFVQPRFAHTRVAHGAAVPPAFMQDFDPGEGGTDLPPEADAERDGPTACAGKRSDLYKLDLVWLALTAPALRQVSYPEDGPTFTVLYKRNVHILASGGADSPACIAEAARLSALPENLKLQTQVEVPAPHRWDAVSMTFIVEWQFYRPWLEELLGHTTRHIPIEEPARASLAYQSEAIAFVHARLVELAATFKLPRLHKETQDAWRTRARIEFERRATQLFDPQVSPVQSLRRVAIYGE